MARLFGLPAADPTRARVLELGCADGTNLLPMAEQFPGTTFLGLDASKVQIAVGLEAIAASGLKNIELRQQDILNFPASEGKFDYIIAHGVFSWVPDAVREKILAICAAHLTENGVAYISYNALPGWNMRRSLRDMMLFHTKHLADPKAKVQQARALLEFITESVPTENNAYGQMLRSEWGYMKGEADNFLLHDILGAENTPFYFHDFIDSAERHGMKYLGEPNISEMLATNFPDKISGTLAQLNKQIVAQEQYMDFIRNRSFRQTLLCRVNIAIRRNLAPANLTEFAFRSHLRNATGPIELVPGVPVGFSTASGAQISSTDAFVKAIFWTLLETRGVTAISFGDLLKKVRSLSRSFLGEVPWNRDQIDEETLQTNLLNLLAKGFVDIYAEPVKIRADVPAKPEVGALVRYQALQNRHITNRLHQSVPADLPSRYVIAACDGTRTHDEILSELMERVKEGKLQVNEGATRILDETKLRAALRSAVDNGLAAIANGGFFVP
jgi:methyltransferase-like protein/2-polyprenyl-3-methyl-5-hydroxy-6-metoxy-1,4-benzoquinol methylase